MHRVVERYLDRRTLLRGSLSAALAMMAGAGLSGCFDKGSKPRPPQTQPQPGRPDPQLPQPQPGQPAPLRLSFDSIAGSRTDACVVPPGYSAQVLAPWGTPLNSAARPWQADRSEEHTSELQSRENLVCRL